MKLTPPPPSMSPTTRRWLLWGMLGFCAVLWLGVFYQVGVYSYARLVAEDGQAVQAQDRRY